MAAEAQTSSAAGATIPPPWKAAAITQMRDEPARSGALDVLTDGGETGGLIRAHDQTSTPLGPPEARPAPLKTA